MELKVGQTVYIEGWDTERGYYVRKCEITRLTIDTASLRPVAVIYPGADGVVTEPSIGATEFDRPRNYIKEPILERIKTFKKEVETMLSAFRDREGQ